MPLDAATNNTAFLPDLPGDVHGGRLWLVFAICKSAIQDLDQFAKIHFLFNEATVNVNDFFHALHYGLASIFGVAELVVPTELGEGR